MMKKIKNIRQLRAEQQKLIEKQIRLEEKMSHQLLTLQENNRLLVKMATGAFSLLSNRWWQTVLKKWFDVFKS